MRLRCSDARLMLDAYVAGDLTEETTGQVGAHVRACPLCSRDASAASKAIQSLAGLPARSVPAGFTQRVMERIKATATPPNLPHPPEARYFVLETSLGEATVAYMDRDVVHLSIGEEEEEVRARLVRRLGVEPVHRAPPHRLSERILKTIEARETWSRARVRLGRVSRFERLVLEKVQEISFGSVRPYWWVAKEIGKAQAARAVAGALDHNPVPVLIPCHRVVMADGSLGGYVLGREMKRRLLEREGFTPMDVRHSVTVLYGCRTTGIFCFPTCPHARRLRPENVVPFHTTRDARAGGYRPCLVCRPA